MKMRMFAVVVLLMAGFVLLGARCEAKGENYFDFQVGDARYWDATQECIPEGSAANVVEKVARIDSKNGAVSVYTSDQKKAKYAIKGGRVTFYDGQSGAGQVIGLTAMEVGTAWSDNVTYEGAKYKLSARCDKFETVWIPSKGDFCSCTENPKGAACKKASVGAKSYKALHCTIDAPADVEPEDVMGLVGEVYFVKGIGLARYSTDAAGFLRQFKKGKK